MTSNNRRKQQTLNSVKARMEGNDNRSFLLKYRFSFMSIGLSIFSTIMIGVFTFLLIANHSIFLSLFFSLFTLFLVLTVVIQFILPRKAFHFLVDRDLDQLIIDNGLRTSKIISLSDINGVALSWQTTKGSTFYLLQLAVPPDVWCHFYKKEKKLEQYRQQYEELYIVLTISNQKDDEVYELTDFIVQSGIPKRSFVKSVLGKYQGVPKVNKFDKYSNENSPIVVKQRRQKQLSKILRYLFIAFSIIYLAFRLFVSFN